MSLKRIYVAHLEPITRTSLDILMLNNYPNISSICRLMLLTNYHIQIILLWMLLKLVRTTARASSCNLN